MVKMIFSDFDETLLNYYGEKNYFDQYQVNVLRRLMGMKIGFSIVTGRCVSFFNQFSEIMDFVGFIVSSNGSCIYDVLNKKYIYHVSILDDVIENIVHYAKENGLDIVFNIYGNQYSMNEVFEYSNCEQVILKVPENMLEYVLKDISLFSHISFNNICKHGNLYTIDINDESVSKGNGVSFLCNYLGIDLDDTICFGDSDNDVSMFEVVGKSISVLNGKDRIKTLANRVILSSADAGVFKYIDENIIKDSSEY